MSADDVVAIQNLLAEYNHCIDGGEAEAWADLFAPDGSLDTGMAAVVSGRDTFIEFVKNTNAIVPGPRHIISNVSIAVDGNNASGRCYLQLWVPSEDGPKIMLTGRYRDTFVKLDGNWRFLRRHMTAD